MAWTRTYDGDEPVRVNKWLAQSGVCSRREADQLIADGLVKIDGQRVMDAGRRIQPGETLSFAGGAAAQLDQQVTVVINKPVGFVSAQAEGNQVPALRLVRRENLYGRAEHIPGPRQKLAPVGRLDQDSHGLLILSEDGVLAKAVIGPESLIDKEYIVSVSGRIDRPKIQLLRHGLELDGRQLRPAKVTQEDSQVLRFVLTEGRNRQIRRMCELVGLDVTDLMRIRIGPVALGDLPEGQWRLMSAHERDRMVEASRPPA
jgi:23S rRNA pseudouridine2604 synthase